MRQLRAKLVADGKKFGDGCDPDRKVGDFTMLELHHAFDRVIENQAHWKAPIDATIRVPKRAQARTLEAIRKAVIHFTGSVATITPAPGGLFRVEADGYYRAVGA